MTNKQIETSREIRLWFTRVILPAFGIAMMIPESRQVIMAKTKQIAGKINSKLQK